ncbi:MAG: tripartite tricarboxylate transporter substrate binding protein [Alphaproteobacteria bacterium]|nr:tripartite tricarboxylate transporter substrate binding protein [Alphaproteobacteria bacterium]
MVNGFAAGGSADVTCRILSDALKPLWTPPVVVDIRSGANGFIAAEAVARAPADGHTMLMATMGMMAISPELPGARLPIDPGRELKPICNVVGLNVMLVVHPSTPFRSVPEIIAYGKANPGKLAYGSAGHGSSPHLCAALFAKLAGFEALHVPYRGGAPAILDLIAGRVQFMIANFPEVIQQARQGQLRALALGGSQPASQAPEVPLLKQWVPDYEVTNWFGLVGATALPAEVVAGWNAAVGQAIAQPAVRQRFADNNLELIGGTPGQFQQTITSYRSRFGAVIRELGIRVE